MNESLLISMIDEYSISNGKLPDYICGTFAQLMQMNEFTSYCYNKNGACYVTPVGTVNLKLDAKAKNIYLI